MQGQVAKLVTLAAALPVSDDLVGLEDDFRELRGIEKGRVLQLTIELGALLVEIESTGIWISSVLLPTDFGFRSRLPLTLVNSPYQVVKPICEMLNSTRVCVTARRRRLPSWDRGGIVADLLGEGGGLHQECCGQGKSETACGTSKGAFCGRATGRGDARRRVSSANGLDRVKIQSQSRE